MHYKSNSCWKTSSIFPISRGRQQEGVALISSLAFLVVMVILVAVASIVGLKNRTTSSENYAATRAQYAAEAGVEYILHEAYTEVLDPVYRENSAWQGNLLVPTYQKKLNDSLIGDEQVSLLPNNQWIWFRDNEIADGGTFDVKVRRQDESERTILTVESTGFFGEAERRVEQTLTIQYDNFDGGQFAVLSNNVNCIFCHTTVTSIEAGYDDDGEIVRINGNEDELEDTTKVRVATLDSLMVDRAVDSVIAGTIYTRGQNNILNRGGAKTVNFKETDDGQVTDKLDNDGITDFTEVDCGNSNSERGCPKGGNFYSNYPGGDAPDGNIPNEFPLPVDDANGNRKIDNDEWKKAIANDQARGRIKGGQKKIMATSADGLPSNNTLGNAGGTLETSNSTSGINGNLILKGTNNAPLVIEENVFVNGDVVISGRVKGNGKIVARGNIYVVGDIEYDCTDTSEDKKQDCDYSKPDELPEFGLVAGGNMMIGSYMQTASGDQGWTKTYENEAYQRWSWTKDANGDWRKDSAGNQLTYEDEYFGNSLTNTNDFSAEYVDPGKYMPFIDPNTAWSDLSDTQQSALIESFGPTASLLDPDSSQRRSYARATRVYGDAKGTVLGQYDGGEFNKQVGFERTRGSFTANEMAAFNQREYCKAASTNRSGCDDAGVARIAGHVPRYYKLREDGPIYRCANFDPSECRGYGDPLRGNDPNQTSYYAGANFTEIKSNDSTLNNANVLNVAPTDNWLSALNSAGVNTGDQRESELELKKLWVDNVESNDQRTDDKPLQIDGTLYSGNAIFTIGAARSDTCGSITINGSVVAADLGVLAAGCDGEQWKNRIAGNDSQDNSGLRIHYDSRLVDLLGLSENSGLIITRSNYEQLSADPALAEEEEE